MRSLGSCRSRSAASLRPIFALALGTCLATSTGVRAALAAPPDDVKRKLASDLADRGSEQFDQQRWELALENFRAAYKTLPSPVIALYEGRCLVKLGRLVEATEAYDRAETFKLPTNPSAASRSAVVSAHEEATALRARVPRLSVVARDLAQSEAKNVAVKIDGRPLAADDLGLERPIDPGVHRIEGSREGERWQVETVTLREGERRLVTLHPETTTKPVASDPSPAPPPTPAPPPPPPRGRRGTTLGIVALSVGGAGMITGITAGFIMLSQKSDLTAACPSKSCPPSAYGDLDLYERTRTVSNVGYGVGIVGLGVGTVLLLTRPSAETARVQPFVGPGSAGVVGAF